MELSEDIKIAKDILQNLSKAKKTLRMYPPNNPIYIKTIEDSYEKFRNFFNYKDELTLKVGQNSISYDSEQIYYNPEKEDNLALFFFKDGLRELTFKKGLLKEELEEFLKIIALDFDREIVDDDVVTLLWEKDFHNIQYVADDSFLFDTGDEDYEAQAVTSAKQKGSGIEGLKEAYGEGFKEEQVDDVPMTFPVALSDEDLQMLIKELEKDLSDKIEKLTAILFELLYHSEEMSELREDSIKYLKDAIMFCIKRGDIITVLHMMKQAREMIEEPLSTEEMKKYMEMLLQYIGTDEVISILGELLDSGIEIEEQAFKGFVELLDKNAIAPLIKILGELKTWRGREKVIEALVFLGRKDIKAFAKSLNDHRWYVVRNIIYILRTIGDRGAVEHLMKAINHGDTRVRKEVIRALGELGGQGVLQALKERLDDTDAGVRTTSAKAIGNIGSEAAKRIILEKMSDKLFKGKDFEEKKELYEVLSTWKDKEVFEFLIRALNKTSFFGRAMNNENRACAAYCLGLLGDKDALPFLYRYKDSKNKLLREFSSAAINRIEHGQ